MADLRQHISSVATRDPVDGTLTKPSTAKRLERGRSSSTRSAIAAAWKCPGCGSATNDVNDYARHITLEFVTLRDRVNQVVTFLVTDDVREQPVHLTNLVDVVQVAEMLDVSTRYVRYLAQDGRLNGRQVARSWFFDRQDVETYLLMRDADQASTGGT